MTAILAPRFLASAFAAGPALLILLCLILKKVAGFDAGKQAIEKLSLIVTYAMVINVFLVLMEFFTAFYSRIPEHMEHFQYVFFGLEGDYYLAPWMWLSLLLAALALLLLLVPQWRTNPRLLPVACVFVFVSLWLDKGLGLIVGGFTPSPFGTITHYAPTLPESTIVARHLGHWGPDDYGALQDCSLGT